MKHVVDSVNKFCSTDKYLLCADGKVVYLGYLILFPYLYRLQVHGRASLSSLYILVIPYIAWI